MAHKPALFLSPTREFCSRFTLIRILPIFSPSFKVFVCIAPMEGLPAFRPVAAFPALTPLISRACSSKQRLLLREVFAGFTLGKKISRFLPFGCPPELGINWTNSPSLHAVKTEILFFSHDNVVSY